MHRSFQKSLESKHFAEICLTDLATVNVVLSGKASSTCTTFIVNDLYKIDAIMIAKYVHVPSNKFFL